MRTVEFGFDPFTDDISVRATALVESLTEDQREQLTLLAEHRSLWYRDAKDFLRQQVAMILADRSTPAAQRAVDYTLASGDIILRGMTKFSLAVGEIIAFGKVQGELPPLESERIIK